MAGFFGNFGIGEWCLIFSIVFAGWWAIWELRGRALWAPRKTCDDIDKIGKAVQVHETRITGLEQAGEFQNEILTRSVVEPLNRLSSQMDSVVEVQSQQREDSAAMREAIKGLGKSVDDLREQVKAVRDR